jgi:DNA repair exonuclease SbcCD ATPase subunit
MIRSQSIPLTRSLQSATVPALADTLATPEDEELHRKKAQLAELEIQLADRELDLASLRSDLIHFEKRYLDTVGRRYAILDDLKAQIAEARARKNPQREEARQQARQARTKAEESARSAGVTDPGAAQPDNAASPETPVQSDTLKKLYRKAAKLIHPDQTLNADEKQKRHELMVELNDAYARGDEERIRAILRNWHASPESVQGDGPGAELVRIIRTIAQVQKRLKAIAAEIEQLRAGELSKLKQAVDDALANGRELLKDLSERLDGEIADARAELKQVMR